MPWSNWHGGVQSKVGLEDLRDLFDLIHSMILKDIFPVKHKAKIFVIIKFWYFRWVLSWKYTFQDKIYLQLYNCSNFYYREMPANFFLGFFSFLTCHHWNVSSSWFWGIKDARHPQGLFPATVNKIYHT